MVRKNKNINFNYQAFESKRPIVLIAGGTGGHIIPAMRVASELVQSGRKVVFITDRRFKQYESLFTKYSFFSSSNLRIMFIPIRTFSASPTIFTFIFDIFISFIKCLYFIFNENPRLFVGFGGYVCFPALFSAVITFKNIVIHEQNCVFGRINRMFLKYASTILFSFPEIGYIPKKQYRKIKDKLVISGLPNFLDEDRAYGYKIIHDISAKEEIVILITGGGQGATFFSFNIPPAIILLAQTYNKIKFKIFHQVRESEIKQVKELYENAKLSNISVIIESLFTDIPRILMIADFAIIRGGAASIAEVTSSRVFPIIIPMPNSSEGHQLKNAKCIVKNNAGVLVNQLEYTPQKLMLIISKAINDGLFYFPLINSASDFFPKNSVNAFLNVVLYSDLDFIHYDNSK